MLESPHPSSLDDFELEIHFSSDDSIFEEHVEDHFLLISIFDFLRGSSVN